MQKTEELISELIEENEQGIKLFEIMNEHRVLDSIFFKPHHKALLPMVLMSILKKKKEEKERGALSSNHAAHPDSQMPPISPLTPKMAYKILKKEKPDSELNSIVSHFIMSHLPKQFLSVCESEMDSEAQQHEIEEITVFNLEGSKEDLGSETTNQRTSEQRMVGSNIGGSIHMNGSNGVAFENLIHERPTELTESVGCSVRLGSNGKPAPKKRFLNFDTRKHNLNEL